MNGKFGKQVFTPTTKFAVLSAPILLSLAAISKNSVNPLQGLGHC